MGLNTENLIVKSYLELMRNLDADSKETLIRQLSSSLKPAGQKHDNDQFLGAFGSWDKNEVAEEIIDKIKNSREFNRSNEPL